MGILTQDEEVALYKKMFNRQMFFSAVATASGAAVISCANISIGSLGIWEKILVAVGIISLTSKDLAQQHASIVRGLAKGKAPGEDPGPNGGEGNTTQFFPIGSGATQTKTQTQQQLPKQ